MRRSTVSVLVLSAAVVAALLIWRNRAASTTSPREPDAGVAGVAGNRAPPDRAPPRAPATRQRLPPPADGEENGTARPMTEPAGTAVGDEIRRQYEAAHQAIVAAARGCDLGAHRDDGSSGRLRLRYLVGYRDGEGHVVNVELLESGFGDRALDACVKDKVAAARWRAAMPDGAMDAPFEDELGLDELR
jgi:hypothetical protein